MRTVIHKTLILVLLGSALCLTLWRAQYGVDLYDEPLYLLSAFKLQPLGDLPFRDEVHSGLRHYDFLNATWIRPWAPYSVLALRQLAVLFYASVLALVAFIFWGRHWTLLGATLLGGLLLFDQYLNPTWSHNWWCRNLLLLHHGLLWLGWKRNHTLLAAGAGLAIGMACVAYNPMFALTLASLTALVVLRKSLGMGSSSLKMYVLGAIIPIALDLTYCLSPDVREHWWSAVATMFADYRSGGKITNSKPVTLFLYVVKSREFWLCSLCGVLGLWTKFRKLSLILGGMATIYLVRRWFALELHFLTLSTLIGLGFSAGTLLLVCERKNIASRRLAALGGFTLASACLMGLVSHGASTSLYWAMPSVLIPFLQVLQRTVRNPFTWAPVYVLIVHLYCGAALHQLVGQTTDTPPPLATATLQTPPLAGIRTSPHRAKLIETLSRYTQEESFALSLGIPGVFFFGNTRSATDSIIIHPNFPPQLGRQGLERMVARHRLPEIAFIERQQVWMWGRDITPVVYLPDNPYLNLLSCAYQKTLESVPELQIIQLDAAKLPQCVRSVIPNKLG